MEYGFHRKYSPIEDKYKILEGCGKGDDLSCAKRLVQLLIRLSICFWAVRLIPKLISVIRRQKTSVPLA